MILCVLLKNVNFEDSFWNWKIFLIWKRSKINYKYLKFKAMARIITDQNFLDNIKVGEFSKIIKYVINDEDLSVQIRDNKLIFIIMVEIFLE